MRARAGAFLFACCLLTATQAQDSPKHVSNFTLSDFNGAKHSLTDFKSAKAVVLVFIATQCPVSNAYNDRMEQISKDFSGRGVTFIGINSNRNESPEEIKQHAGEHGLTFLILKDVNNTIADKLGASVTPEAYLLDAKFDLLYHGRIDDSRRESQVTSMDLRSALEAVLAGKPVPVQETKAFGCTIKRVPRG